MNSTAAGSDDAMDYILFTKASSKLVDVGQYSADGDICLCMSRKKAIFRCADAPC